MQCVLYWFILPMLATAAPYLNSTGKPPAFFLAGDSTTAIQSTNGGGWGNGFLSFLNYPAWGINKGHNGATTVSFVNGGDWADVTDLVSSNAEEFDVYVTIQFGHNDQKAAANITMAQFQTNLENMAEEVKSLGGTPILVTSLTRRTFNAATGTVVDSLQDVATATRAAANTTDTALLDLNAASMAYVNAIGNASAQAYNLNPTDQTHLNAWGSVVFGRMVADLLLEEKPMLEEWILPNNTLSWEIANGVAA
ncbi:SGNH hydrolase-type esterase domain-containing protein [Pseudomassariella vexata]|uniref:SGNH hydrolase-type esterase domain-containing protein n=1 Tax=Pseudomassariella vexata TaxID=1141098 RepID=A0A1Y2ELJ4_9PEZI|nr:SGNH hydrolase-type esterase domain-containing protein [Pseudomassariella vexata]ORY72174.1 SGNH hydrolase-type esterase domain-containing protein [Pseudomassariella vexata]